MADYTDNGVEIEIGLRVFTTDWSWGTVTSAPASWDTSGWWMVTLDTGQTKTYNGERMTTRAPSGAPADPHPR